MRAIAGVDVGEVAVGTRRIALQAVLAQDFRDDIADRGKVGRAGAPENVQLGTTDRGERSLTLTYMSGPRPGIYRFAAGRLYAIERGEEPPPEPAKPKKPAPKKPKSA